MLSMRLIFRLTETEQLIATEITEGVIAHLSDIRASLQPSFDELNIDPALRSKIDALFEKSITYQKQDSSNPWGDDDES
jgi:hypothetical protein